MRRKCDSSMCVLPGVLEDYRTLAPDVGTELHDASQAVGLYSYLKLLRSNKEQCNILYIRRWHLTMRRDTVPWLLLACDDHGARCSEVLSCTRPWEKTYVRRTGAVNLNSSAAPLRQHFSRLLCRQKDAAHFC
ncbi:hypothetical protein RR48_15482 [Papilio machaon]|uniref:Uncharacterized protein n=1 Tax=Papilio machaon TaxID=76193 RepID=A0A194R0H6_PAPMA|nr:hypothetical protein RR48_15482 [Papilio machaon]